MIASPACSSLKELNCQIQDFRNGQEISINDQVRMFMSMRQPSILIIELTACPIKSTSFLADLIGYIQVNQNVWVSDSLPHVWSIGVLLGNMACNEPMSFKPIDQCGFS